MTHTQTQGKLVLAIQPTTRGFGFAVFAGPLRPVDWGVKDVTGNKNKESLQKIDALISLYEPYVIVVEDYTGEGSRRAQRIQRLLGDIEDLAKRRKIRAAGLPRGRIRQYFSEYGAITKYEIAKTIAKRLPEFELRLPPVRKPWMSEDYRMAIFDAVSFALAYFHFDRKKRNAS